MSDMDFDQDAELAHEEGLLFDEDGEEFGHDGFVCRSHSTYWYCVSPFSVESNLSQSLACS